MIIQTVTFKSRLSDEEALRIMEERAPQYREIPGLIQKYYVRAPKTGEIGGVYVWDSEESLKAFRASELARTIAAAYQMEGQSSIETLDVLFPLRQEQATATTR